MSEKIKIGGILIKENLCMMQITGVENKPGSAAKVFQIFSGKRASLEFISESRNPDGHGSITVCISANFCPIMGKIEAKIQEYAHPEKIFRHPQVVMMTIYGPHFGDVPSIASNLCQALAKCDVNIHGISTAINSITCVIDSKDLNSANDAMGTVFKTPD
ncbi:MAG: ACT domain-containing protein [Bacteroidetes bacterium]|jgi:aspartate kinase|nr:ACT domain-containing protein [Bacteroidota bacterium]